MRDPNARLTGDPQVTPPCDGIDDHVDDRADVREVARLGAVAVHRERLARVSAAWTKAGITAA